MNIPDIQKAIAGEQLDGWLFFNFLHRDSISDRILGLNPDRMNSRPWYYLVPVAGNPVKICNAVEPESLSALPGETVIYKSRIELIEYLKMHCARFGRNWGAQYSEELTTVSTLDHGTALMLQSAGMLLSSSAGLIQRLNGLIDSEGIKSHEAAAEHLYRIVGIVWNRIRREFLSVRAAGIPERKVQQWILDEFSAADLITDHLPIVACGANSGNPHYAPEEHSNLIKPDNVLQLDIWARENSKNSIFADISWVGWTGTEVPDEVQKMFNAVTAARDGCAEFIASRLSEEKPVTGAEADSEARRILIQSGYEDFIKHRTGHGIDTALHGSGTGLDSVEFPDKRHLIEGSCFSIEPGLYTMQFGMRTEIDAYISGGKLKISGPGPQTKILTF